MKRKLISSTSSETVASAESVKKAFAWKDLAEALWCKKVPIEFVTDSGPLMDQLESGQAKAEPAMNGLLAYVRQELRRLRSRVYWCRTSDMRADRQTKLMLERCNGNVPSTAKVVKKEKAGARVKKIDFAKRSSMCMRVSRRCG